MYLRTTQDIPSEVKRVIELFYVQDASVAQTEAIKLKCRKPEWDELIDDVMDLFGHAPESVFTFYDELIARNMQKMNSSPTNFDDDLDISLGDSLSGLMDDEAPKPTIKPERHSRWTMNGTERGSDGATPIPGASLHPSSPENSGFDIDLSFNEPREMKTPRPASFGAGNRFTNIPGASMDASEDDVPHLDISAMFNDAIPEDKNADMPVLNISAMMDAGEETPQPASMQFRDLRSQQGVSEMTRSPEMTRGPMEGGAMRSSPGNAFNSSELQRLRSNMAAGSADIMRAASQKSIKHDSSDSRRLLNSESAPGVPSITPLKRGEGRARAYTASGLPSPEMQGGQRPTALNLTPVSGFKAIPNEHRSSPSVAAPLPSISIAGMGQKANMNAEKQPSVSLPPVHPKSGSGGFFSAISEDPKPTAVSLQPISMAAQKPQFSSENEAKQTVIAMSPIAITPRRKLDADESKRALELIQPISRIPMLKCRLAEISQRKDINPRAGFILSMIDGFTSISDILDISAWPEPETAELLLELERQGIVAFT